MRKKLMPQKEEKANGIPYKEEQTYILFTEKSENFF